MQSRTAILTALLLSALLGLGGCNKGASSNSASAHFKRGAHEMVQGAKQAATEAQETVADGAITAHVKARLAANQGLSSLDIHVRTEKGIVHLTGQVNSQAARKLAGEVASKTDRVRIVVNELTIKSDQGH